MKINTHTFAPFDDFEVTARQNRGSFNSFFMRFMNMCTSRFIWNNVPEGINVTYFEKTLTTQGGAVVFWEEGLGKFLSLQYAGDTRLDVYGNPTSYTAIADNGEQFRNLNPSNSSLCWNNRLHTSDMPTIIEYCWALWNIQEAIENNANQQRFSTVVLCDESQRLTMENLMKKYQGNVPFIFGSKNLGIDGIKPLPTQIPFVADKLVAIRDSLIHDACIDLGVTDYNSDKRERLTALETVGSTGALQLVQYSYLYERRDFCDRFNTLYGTNMSVNVACPVPDEPERGVFSGDIYDNNSEYDRERV